MDGHGVARLLRDGGAHVGLDGQLVGAVAEGHERAAERMAVDGAADLHQAAGAEVRGRTRHDHICPPALVRALLQRCRDLLTELAHRTASWCSTVPNQYDEGGSRDSSLRSDLDVDADTLLAGHAVVEPAHPSVIGLDVS